MSKAYIGLGSNLASPLLQLKAGIKGLKNLPQTTLLKLSKIYRSPFLGKPHYPDVFNAVALLETTLSPHQLLSHMQKLERLQGRIGKGDWKPRTLDLDLLIYENISIHTNDLILPHPGILSRAFVLKPLADIDPALVATLKVKEVVENQEISIFHHAFDHN